MRYGDRDEEDELMHALLFRQELGRIALRHESEYADPERIKKEPESYIVVKYGASLPFSTEQLKHEGLIPDTTSHQAPSRLQRVRWWFAARSERVRVKIASWIVGYDIEDV